MGIPKITAGDLIALRDGGDAAVGIEIALRNNPAAQRELLESRLLALALSMPRGLDTTPTAVAAAEARHFDPETLAAYVGGELLDDDLARFETAVRGNPARFAELVAFKNAYFGRTRAASTPAPRATPPIERIEIGVLTLHSAGDRTFLSWDGPGQLERGVFEPPRAFALRTPRFKSDMLYDAFEPGGDERPLDDRELNDFQQEMMAILQEVRERLRYAQKSNDPEALYKAGALLRMVEQMSERQRDNARQLRQKIEQQARVSAALAAYLKNGGSTLTEVSLAIGGHQLRFASVEGTPGTLTLRIVPGTHESEFTWVRPGLDFTLLPQSERMFHELSPVRGEAQLIIDRKGIPTTVVRVRMA